MPQVRQAAVILNPSSGQKQVSDEDISTALKDVGINETEVIQLANGIDLSRTVADCIARKADVVIAAGGDGTSVPSRPVSPIHKRRWRCCRSVR